MLAAAGDGIAAPPGHAPRPRSHRAELPALYAAADVLVLPSIRTRTFTEPWGLVTNEAMHQGTPVIATDAVGAVAGGLVRDGRNGLVVRAPGMPTRSAPESACWCGIPSCARGWAMPRARTSRAYTPEAWAEGVSRALAAAGAGRLLR